MTQHIPSGDRSAGNRAAELMPPKAKPRQVAATWSRKAAFWQGWCDGCTGHAAYYELPSGVQRGFEGMTFDDAVAYLEGAMAFYCDGLRARYSR